MQNVYVSSDNLTTSLGYTTCGNFDKLKKGISGISLLEDEIISRVPVFCSRIADDYTISKAYTKLENLAIHSITDALKKSDTDISNPKTLIIISTTKGNIDLLEAGKTNNFDRNRLYLWKMAEIITAHFKNPNRPVVVSNACISGLLSIITAARLIKSGTYDDVVICGADLLTEFVVAGFQSFKALGSTACKPFDGTRDGLSLGESAGTLILSANKNQNLQQQIVFSGGSTSNDANHISGPSRTGDELFYCIRNAMAESQKAISDISFINAHGTATPYNDEMESKAFITAGFYQTPVNSFKGYFGHTLGAAGIIETISGIASLIENLLIKSAGYNEPDQNIPLNIIKDNTEKELFSFLKTASGFGGCNAAAIFSKI